MLMNTILEVLGQLPMQVGWQLAHILFQYVQLVQVIAVPMI